MKLLDKKDKSEIESQVVNKMFREDKRYRTRIIPNKKKEYKYDKQNQRRYRFQGLQYEPWET